MGLLQHFLAGIWPLFLKYTFALCGIGAALTFAWFSPIFKKTALWVASGIAIGLVCYHTGVKDGANRVQRQWDAALEAAIRNGESAREDAERDVDGLPAGRVPNDRFDRDQH